MTDCYCDYGDVICEFYEARIVRAARKDHSCYECGGFIKAGESYEYVSALWDGGLSQCKTCARCLAVRQYVKDHVPCFCWLHGSMLDDAKETIREYAHELPGLWFGWARRQVAVDNGPRAPYPWERPLTHRKEGA